MTLASTYTGLRVLDLSSNLAGPFAAMILGDLGADVIKIERPQGDDTRSLPPFRAGGATVFDSVNRNKRSLVLDLGCAAGKDALLKLTQNADVVIESFGPGVAAKLGLTFEDLRAHNERIVVATVSAFGDGPIGRGVGGYDALVQAVSGMMSFTGHPGTPPVRVAPSVIDLSTGLWAVIAIMACVSGPPHARHAVHLNSALIDSAFALMGHQILGFLETGEEPEKLGSQAPSAAPYGVYDTTDGSLMIATANDAQFARLCDVVGFPELAADSRFATSADRIASRAELNELLAGRLAQATTGVWLERLAAARISCGPVNGIGAALADPLGAERGIIVRGGSDCPVQLRLPIDRDGACLRLPPPVLGQHSVEVLQEAGFDDATIAVLTRMQETSELNPGVEHAPTPGGTCPVSR